MNDTNIYHTPRGIKNSLVLAPYIEGKFFRAKVRKL